MRCPLGEGQGPRGAAPGRRAALPHAGLPAPPRSVAAAGVNGATVHTLRHTFATHHARRKTSLPVIKEMLGHASLKTTERYIQLARELMDREVQQNAL